MPPSPQHYQAQESTASAKSRLALLLAGCTDKALRAMTCDQLAATHRVRFADVVVMLAEARAKRGWKPDGSRIGEAIAYVRGSSNLDGLTCYDLAAKFNLWPGTAETVLAKERERGRRGG